MVTTGRLSQYLCGVFAFALAGCYSYVPVESQGPAPVGQMVELQITDRGRVGLGERLGAGVRDVTGRVVGNADSDIVLSIDRITTIAGTPNLWRGDTARIGRDYVGSMSLRKISAGKTTAVVAVVAAAVYVLVNRTLAGSGDGSEDGTEPPPVLTTRIPFGVRFTLP